MITKKIFLVFLCLLVMAALVIAPPPPPTPPPPSEISSGEGIGISKSNNPAVSQSASTNSELGASTGSQPLSLEAKISYLEQQVELLNKKSEYSTPVIVLFILNIITLALVLYLLIRSQQLGLSRQPMDVAYIQCYFCRMRGGGLSSRLCLCGRKMYRPAPRATSTATDWSTN